MDRRILTCLPVLLVACSANSSAPNTTAGGGTGSGGANGSAGMGIVVGNGGGGVTVGACSKDCTDFPAEPIFDSGAPADAASKFGDPSAGGPAAACITEPAPGSLVPRNWWRPRIHFTPQPGQLVPVIDNRE